MKAGTIVGRVWATKRLSKLPSGALMEVALDDTSDTSSAERIIAFDPLGCAEGERVLVTQGSVARGWFKDANLVDALIIGSLDEEVQKQTSKSGQRRAAR
ncbi:MAG: EutN/CcmL family microcompartment protein [Gammaproteobacteria bacterium]|nr:EutN/CcmL family microcompartment protein [Gammaproteobacteria bacterium]